MHLTDRCRFLNCSVRTGRGEGVEGIRYDSEGISGGREGGERCDMNHNGSLRDRNRCVMNS
jgi:hypothetical protein